MSRQWAASVRGTVIVASRSTRSLAMPKLTSRVLAFGAGAFAILVGIYALPYLSTAGNPGISFTLNWPVVIARIAFMVAVLMVGTSLALAFIVKGPWRSSLAFAVLGGVSTIPAILFSGALGPGAAGRLSGIAVIAACAFAVVVMGGQHLRVRHG